MYTFIITDKTTGVVLDFGTYHHDRCTRDTAIDSPAYKPGSHVTTVMHDDDGSYIITATYDYEE